MSRELDAQIAGRVMGWTNIHVNDRGEMYAVTPDSAPGRTRVNPFTTDLNACAEAEQRIISMGEEMAVEYIFQLESEIKEVVVNNDFIASYPTVARLVTASAEARCRAMLRALEQEGK